MAITLVLTIVVAVPLGVVAAWKAGSWVDRTIMAFAVFALLASGLRGRIRARLRVRAASSNGFRCRATRRWPKASGRGCRT